MSEWKKVRLGDISIDGGHYGIGAAAVEYDESLPTYLRITDIREDGTIIREGLKSVDDPNACEYYLKPNDLVIARTGASTGRNYFYDGRDGQFVYAGFLIRFSIDERKIWPPYVKYWFQGSEYRTWLLNHTDGSTRANINAVTLGDCPIFCPTDVSTQRKIAAVLGALDDKIENNRKICANLEAQAQAIFKSWFVDFEPFGGKQITDVIWGNHPEELRYVKVGSINPILETGSRPKGGAALSGIPSIGAENVKQLGEFDFGAKKFIPEEYAAKLKRGKINGYELLLYKDGGKPGMFKPHFSMFGEGFPYEECYINEHVFKVDFGNRATNIFAYFYFKSQYVFNWLEMNGGKAAIPGINQSNVLDVMMPDPTHKLVREFGESVEPLFKMIFNICKESRALAATRDALLPKLMSGEIDVEKVEVA